MGEIKAHPEVLLLLAVFSRYDRGFQWASQTAEETWGPIALESVEFSFDQTDQTCNDSRNGDRYFSSVLLHFRELI